MTISVQLRKVLQVLFTAICYQESNNGATKPDSMPVYYGRGGKYSGKPRVVVLGSGWGAMSFIKSLSRRDRCAKIWLCCCLGTLSFHVEFSCSCLKLRELAVLCCMALLHGTGKEESAQG